MKDRYPVSPVAGDRCLVHLDNVEDVRDATVLPAEGDLLVRHPGERGTIVGRVDVLL